jgi:hypothetical protein
MDRESVERLRFDRRLKTRDGWIASSQEDDYLASLPDLTDKMTTCAAEEDAAEAERVESSNPLDLQSEAPAPVAGDFSTSHSEPTTVAAPAADALPDQGSAGTFPSEGNFAGDADSN